MKPTIWGVTNWLLPERAAHSKREREAPSLSIQNCFFAHFHSSAGVIFQCFADTTTRLNFHYASHTLDNAAEADSTSLMFLWGNETGGRFQRKKIVTKMILKIITKCNFDFQTCVNYQFFPFQDNFFGYSELREGSQN